MKNLISSFIFFVVIQVMASSRKEGGSKPCSSSISGSSRLSNDDANPPSTGFTSSENKNCLDTFQRVSQHIYSTGRTEQTVTGQTRTEQRGTEQAGNAKAETGQTITGQAGTGQTRTELAGTAPSYQSKSNNSYDNFSYNYKPPQTEALDLSMKAYNPKNYSKLRNDSWKGPSSVKKKQVRFNLSEGVGRSRPGPFHPSTASSSISRGFGSYYDHEPDYYSSLVSSLVSAPFDRRMFSSYENMRSSIENLSETPSEKDVLLATMADNMYGPMKK
ncbi:hypothetical protein M153_2200055577 [Pseudoloma neurophilia]|uniref:Uncharacterized protein n=1 Tax=Pseudoloma neurophilia TaxID=146866 RepID=A0A0R0M8H3_9MICR|nr:hypothetical protein M153_2200055577 [Pseudoloma neurophilia]